MEISIASRNISANLVAEPDRLKFLPQSFGPRFMLRGESLVFYWMETLSEDYQGGFWNFYTLSNGGFYMAPKSSARLRLQVDGNGFCGDLSADAAGIVVTLFALGQLVAESKDTHGCGVLLDRYHLLREFARTHAESISIFRAID